MGVTPSMGSAQNEFSRYDPNDLLVGPGLEANQYLYDNDPEYRAAYDKIAGNVAYVTANGTLSDAERYQKYAPRDAAKLQKNLDLNALNDRMSALFEQNRANTPAPEANPLFGSLTKRFGMSDFEADPGYQFRMDEGQKAIERSAAARGGLLSGSALKGIERFGQGLASQEYGNAFDRWNLQNTNQFNRLASLAGVGQQANQAIGQAGQNFANAASNIAMNNAANQGNALLAQGNARASGYGAWGNALGNAFANWPAQSTSPAGSMNNAWGFGQNMGYSSGDWA